MKIYKGVKQEIFLPTYLPVFSTYPCYYPSMPPRRSGRHSHCQDHLRSGMLLVYMADQSNRKKNIRTCEQFNKDLPLFY